MSGGGDQRLARRLEWRQTLLSDLKAKLRVECLAKSKEMRAAALALRRGGGATEVGAPPGAVPQSSGSQESGQPSQDSAQGNGTTTAAGAAVVHHAGVQQQQQQQGVGGAGGMAQPDVSVRIRQDVHSAVQSAINGMMRQQGGAGGSNGAAGGGVGGGWHQSPHRPGVAAVSSSQAFGASPCSTVAGSSWQQQQQAQTPHMGGTTNGPAQVFQGMTADMMTPVGTGSARPGFGCGLRAHNGPRPDDGPQAWLYDDDAFDHELSFAASEFECEGLTDEEVEAMARQLEYELYEEVIAAQLEEIMLQQQQQQQQQQEQGAGMEAEAGGGVQGSGAVLCPCCRGAALVHVCGALACPLEGWQLDRRQEGVTLSHLRQQLADTYEEVHAPSCPGRLTFAIEELALGFRTLVARCSTCQLIHIVV